MVMRMLVPSTTHKRLQNQMIGSNTKMTLSSQPEHLDYDFTAAELNNKKKGLVMPLLCIASQPVRVSTQKRMQLPF